MKKITKYRDFLAVLQEKQQNIGYKFKCHSQSAALLAHENRYGFAECHSQSAALLAHENRYGFAVFICSRARR